MADDIQPTTTTLADAAEVNREDISPFNWSVSKKWRVTGIACYVTLIVGINATAMTAAAAPINEQFGVVDRTIPNSYWPVTSWNVGAAVSPMVVIPLLEEYGMRPGYLSCYVIFLLFVIPQALARNFATLVVTRFVAGSAGGVMQDVMDGIIADVWPGPTQRSTPVTLYVLALLAGVSFGPVFGGAVVSHLSWRWISYIQLMLYGASLPLVWYCFEETRLDIILKRHGLKPAASQTRTSESVTHLIYEAVVLPTNLLFTEPVVFFFMLLSATSFGLVYLCTQSVPQVFETLYGWDEGQTGLVQIALVVGELAGAAACVPQNAYFARRLRAAGVAVQSLDASAAELRLPLCVAGCFAGLAGGLLWYAWASYAGVHWILPTVGLGILGFGVMVVMQAIMMYVTDAYERYAGSASAAVCFGEQMFAAFLPLSAIALYTNLGFHWASTLLALVACALGAAPVLLMAKGKNVRRRSKFILKAQFEDAGGGLSPATSTP